MEDSLNRELKLEIISYETFKKQHIILGKIKKYFGDKIPMALLTKERIQEFDAFWRKSGFKHNTVVLHFFVDFKLTYFSLDFNVS